MRNHFFRAVLVTALTVALNQAQAGRSQVGTQLFSTPQLFAWQHREIIGRPPRERAMADERFESDYEDDR